MMCLCVIKNTQKVSIDSDVKNLDPNSFSIDLFLLTFVRY